MNLALRFLMARAARERIHFAGFQQRACPRSVQMDRTSSGPTREASARHVQPSPSTLRSITYICVRDSAANPDTVVIVLDMDEQANLSQTMLTSIGNRVTGEKYIAGAHNPIRDTTVKGSEG